MNALRRLKTYLKSTMGQRLSHLAMVHIEQEIANKVDYSDIIDINFLPPRKEEWTYRLNT